MINKWNLYKKKRKVKRKGIIAKHKNIAHLIKRVCSLFFASCIMCATGLLFLTIVYAVDLPDVNLFFEVQKKRHITLQDISGKTIATQGEIRSSYISFEDLPDHLVNALIATEDRRFFSHFGVDLIGMTRALYANLLAGRKAQGGSTITQQLAKIAFLSPEKTFKRKIQEFLLALYLEHRFDKKQIITAYLNRVYLGSGVFGIDAASHFYFHKSVDELNTLESALLVGMLKAPTRYSPIFHREASLMRMRQILLNMANAGFLTKGEMKTLLAMQVNLKANREALQGSYFAGFVFDQLNSMFPDTGIDLVAKVTVNSAIQDYTQNLIQQYIKKYGKDKHFSQGAALIIDDTGQIITMVGGGDYKASPFNRAYQAKRLAGSAFKPIIYANALIHGYSPDSILVDKPLKYHNWSPRNNSRKFYGSVTLRDAFAMSLNTIPIQLTAELGVANVKSLASAMGITSPLPDDLTLALGTGEVSMLELATAYSVITNNGYLYDPYAVVEVCDSNGEELFSKNSPPIHVLSKKISQALQDLMINAVNNGSGSAAFIDRAVVGGKTGTSQENKDAWFIGFVKGYTIAIWLGNDDNKPMRGVGGASYPAMLFREIGLKILD
jgi:penicillin-binding protein 1A